MATQPASASAPTAQISKALNIALWVLQVLAAAMFLFSAHGKLTSAPMMVEVFGKIGFGQWFRTFTGCVEVAGAILLVIPRTAPMGAGLLAATMIGASLTHLFLIGGNPAAAIVLFVITSFIAWKRSPVLIRGRGAA